MPLGVFYLLLTYADRNSCHNSQVKDLPVTAGPRLSVRHNHMRICTKMRARECAARTKHDAAAVQHNAQDLRTPKHEGLLWTEVWP